MQGAVPQRIPPLAWRKPAFIWTPLALALAIGWPRAALYYDGGLAYAALIVGAATYALALMTLGVSWAIKRPPRTRRAVLAYVLLSGALVSLAAPFLLAKILAAVAAAEERTPSVTAEMALGMAPLALLLGLPMAFLSGLVFSLLAFARPLGKTEEEIRHDVQPFR